MKKGILFIAAMLLLVSVSEANNNGRINSRMGYTNVYDAQPIQFKEKGIQFYVFLDGQFDFSTRPNRNFNNQYKNLNSRRNLRIINNRGLRIERDYRGRIRRVGNVPINYNRLGKVTRIGSVFIGYDFRQVSQVGGLNVLYNHWGDARYIGQVKYNNHRFNGNFSVYNTWNTWEYDFNNDFFLRSNFRNDFESFHEDDNYLYYRSKGVKKGKKGNVIKRKKNKQKVFPNKNTRR
ncbi:hypothetical protein [Urechidicola croceus]|uniref:Uncharacterized protein n=1 Tax=Urechidicola croceus TaxID=1850246 RepID=A0A1D8PBJ2_9FLAO|nr:hypothetical protein [Urechidicola croceus]AOW21936.1 hypothetical protein LPB138_15115 [Urechidicola croceus]